MADGSRRRWEDYEIEKPIDLVEANYEFLSSAFTPAKTKHMVHSKWKSITESINSIGFGHIPLNVTQVRKKWTDIKSISKQAVAKYKNDISRTGGGTSGNTPTKLQFRIAGFIGTVNTQGIAGTEMCDTSASTFVQQMQIVNNEILPSLDLTTSSPTVSQRSKNKTGDPK
jgi:hypothetical protein